MEVSFVKESNYRKEHVLISHSSPVIEPRLIEYAADDGVQGTETCDHFSMRGYVAEFRNKDLKICWPFSMFHDQTSDKHISLLPPLLAAKYKWWDCQNCLHKTNNCATTRANEAPNTWNVEAKIGTIVLGNTFITNDQELLLSFHQLSEEKCAGGLMEAGHSVNVTNDKCCPSANCGKNKNNYKITGLQAAKASQFSCRGIQNLLTNKPDYIATKGEACHMGGRAERDVVSTVNTFEALYSEDMVNAEPKETQVVNESTDIRGVAGPAFIDSVLCGKRDKKLVREMGKAKEQFKEATRETEVPLGNNIGIPEVDYQTAVAADLSELDFRGLDESNNETSDNNIASPQNAVQIQNGTKRLVISDGNLQQEKARKVHLLDDIMRSEEFYSSGKVHISDGNEEVNQIKNRIDRRPHLSRWKDQHFGPEIHQTSQETKVF